MTQEYVGVLIGQVTSRDDPQGEGRIQVTFPTFPDSLGSYWAPIAYPMAGNGRGFRFSPEIGDECLVAFDRGDPDHPYIVGFLHNGVDRPPTDDPKCRIIHSVNGHRIVFCDPDVASGNKGYLRIEDGHGTVIEMSNGHTRVSGVGQLDLSAAVLTIQGRPVTPGSGAI
jgi:uncharacterized protein involved in type VI secretion and phage assembly